MSDKSYRDEVVVHSLRMNPLSYSGRSGRLNFLVYGLVVPVLLTSGISIFGIPAWIKIFSALLGVIMFLTSGVRRGRDIGMTETRTLIILLPSLFLFIILPSLIPPIESIVELKYFLVSMGLFGLLMNFFLVYLFVMPYRNKKPEKTTILEKILLIVVLLLFLYPLMPNDNCMSKNISKKASSCFQMVRVCQSLVRFQIDNGSYPTTKEGIHALISNPNKEKYPHYDGPYFKRRIEQKDAWNIPFRYELKNGEIGLTSNGKDHKAFTKNDISLSECKKLIVGGWPLPVQSQ